MNNVEPWECRDRQHQAEELYNAPLHRSNRALAQENLRLKKLLRQHRIPWSSISRNHLSTLRPRRRTTRSSNRGGDAESLRLPPEILVRILKLAMTSPHPIIDPLSPLVAETLSKTENKRKNQIAIHFLATCKAMHAEGTRYLWRRNHFIFTSPQALRTFGELNAEFRVSIQSITLRVIARYYDDVRRQHTIKASRSLRLEKDHVVPVYERSLESPFLRGGFRCYTWNQVVDFLTALRAPYSAANRKDTKSTSRLLPNLKTLRLDLVNFFRDLVPRPGPELHAIASHELGCTLNELQVTGMPKCDVGDKASIELSGMLRDAGVYADASAIFLAHQKYLTEQPDVGLWRPRLVRAWGGLPAPTPDAILNGNNNRLLVAEWHLPMVGLLPAAPEATALGPSSPRTIWKSVPYSPYSSERCRQQFYRITGLMELKPTLGMDTESVTDDTDSEMDSLDSEMDDTDSEMDSTDSESDSDICPDCGESHLATSSLNYLMEDVESSDSEDDDDSDSSDLDEEMSGLNAD